MRRPAALAPGIPFADLNLRRNPFGALDRSETARLAVAEVDEGVRALRSRLHGGHAPPLAVQYLGPPGCGKTTHLLAIRRRMPEGAYVAWSATEGWPPVPRGVPLLVDDAHLLPPRLARSVLRRRLLALATQRDLSASLTRCGFEVRTVPVEHRVDVERFRKLVELRIEFARRGSGPVPRVSDGELVRVLRRHAPDVRAMLSELYDGLQRCDRRLRASPPGYVIPLERMDGTARHEVAP